jgi:hypothetical protein
MAYPTLCFLAHILPPVSSIVLECPVAHKAAKHFPQQCKPCLVCCAAAVSTVKAQHGSWQVILVCAAATPAARVEGFVGALQQQQQQQQQQRQQQGSRGAQSKPAQSERTLQKDMIHE